VLQCWNWLSEQGPEEDSWGKIAATIFEDSKRLYRVAFPEADFSRIDALTNEKLVKLLYGRHRTALCRARDLLDLKFYIHMNHPDLQRWGSMTTRSRLQDPQWARFVTGVAGSLMREAMVIVPTVLEDTVERQFDHFWQAYRAGKESAEWTSILTTVTKNLDERYLSVPVSRLRAFYSRPPMQPPADW